MNYTDQIEVIKDLSLDEGQSMRMDCPFCMRNNTFSISKEDSKVLWYCFSASCDAKGAFYTEKTMHDIEHYIYHKNKDTDANFVIPTNFISAHTNERCINYLERNNCMSAFTRAKADVRYDPARDRVVFMIHNDKDKIVGGVGRALSSVALPKWYVYGSKNYPFICGSGDTAVVVEDCASACAVSEDYAGVALMGTSLPTEYIPLLQNKFDNIIVALDRDATSKAFDIARELGYRSKTRVVMLEDDLKYFKPNEIRDILCKNDS